MSDPAVSVIIIVLNGAAFLQEAIDSVNAQTFQDFELLIVDDGSTDDTLAMAERERLRRPDRVFVLQHPGGANRGMSATRNLGVANARGSLVAFLDADDVWAPQKLAEQVEIMRRHPAAGLVYGRALIWHSWQDSAQAPADFHYELGVEPNRVYPPPLLFLRQLANTDQTPTTSGSLIRKSLIEQVGGFEAVFQAMFEDQVFFSKALLAAPAYVCDATWIKYRQHPQSATALSAARGADERARVGYLRWLARYLAGQAGHRDERKAVGVALRQARLDHIKRRALRLARRLRRAWPPSR